MTNEEIEDLILGNVLLDLQYYRSDRFTIIAYGHYRNRRGHLLYQKATDAEKGIVPYKPSRWLGRPLSGPERVQFSKVLRSLGEDGLVVRYVDSRERTNHVSLTDEGAEGAEIAESLVAECKTEQ